MIVDVVLEESTWSSNTIACADVDKLNMCYEFMRQLILDSHLYVTKVIGFGIKNKTKRNHTGTYIARNVQIGESHVELARKLSDKLICNSNTQEISVTAGCGILTSEEVKVATGEEILYTSDEICHVVSGNVVLMIKLQNNCGYRDMKQNSNLMSSEYFPMNAYFNINDYVRVLPSIYGDTSFSMRYYNGFTSKHLTDLLVKYSYMVKQELISKEELQWVQSFAL